MKKKPLFVIVAGESGAGRSTAVKALEDVGFYAIDNLPIELFESTVKLIEDDSLQHNQIVVGMEVDDSAQIKKLFSTIDELKDRCDWRTVFVTASAEVILGRYSQTRRIHPFSKDKSLSNENVGQAVRLQKKMLEPFHKQFDHCINTSSWSPYYLAGHIEYLFRDDVILKQLLINIVSFGFKNDVLQPIDGLFDVRFLRNPYYDQKLKEKSGIEPEIQAYIQEDPNFEPFFRHLEKMVGFLIPRYYQERKTYLTIGIGCTGGKHRSVFVAEKLFGAMQSKFEGNDSYSIKVSHRDLRARA